MEKETAVNYLQEVEAEYMRIRGRRGLLKPLDWDLAARWESDGIPLHIVLRTMADIGDKFNRERQGKDQINSLRYFESAVTRAGALFHSKQVGKYRPENTENETPAGSEDMSINDMLESLKNALISLIERTPNIRPIATEIIDELAKISSSAEPINPADFLRIESCLKPLDSRLIVGLIEASDEGAASTFVAAGTSADPVLRKLQIDAAVRRHFLAPEISLL